MEHKALVLTPWMAPHSIIPWYESISAKFGGKATVLEEYDAQVSSPSVTVNIPAVMILRKTIGLYKKDVKFSRSNVYARDHFTCQYCGTKKPAHLLTFDHVLPRSRGGKTVWDNIATACKKCNGKKDNQTPEEAGMRLLRRPVRPAKLPLVTLLALPREVPEIWMPYLEGHALASTG